MNRCGLGIAAMLLGGLAGCEVGPNYRAPTQVMPAQFSKGLSGPSTMPAGTAAPANQETDLTAWWLALDDPELDSLIHRAVAANPDIEIAMTRLQEVRTIQSVALSGAFPLIDVTAGAGRGSGNDSVRGRVGQPVYAGSSTAGLTELTQMMGFDEYWELDVWGKYRRSIEAVNYDAQAAAEARNVVLVSVLYNVARAYLDVRALQARLAIAYDDVKVEQQTVDLMQQRFDRGITNELDLALARRELAQAQATVPPLQSLLSAAQRRVAVLVGQYSDQLGLELDATTPFPKIPTHIEPGIPLELIRHRPDVRQAERQLAGATARIGIATADLFPRLLFTAGAGLQGQGIGRKPVTDNTFIWSAGPALSWPLLDFGALDALVTIRDLQTHEALVNYRGILLDALEQVNDAITEYTAQRANLSRLNDAIIAAKRAVDLATQRYDRGLTDFLNELDAQRQYFVIEDQYAQAEEAVLIQFITLYRDLGGGWQRFGPAKPLPNPRPAVIAAGARVVHPAPVSEKDAAPPSPR
jgi:NodT family efflux transporter outer membrane factor (OMF) lipoprotein